MVSLVRIRANISSKDPIKVSVTDKGTGGQPACPEECKKSKKNMNSSNIVMYIH
jgi:hypothetical protein